jgi:predicted MFS family arabinose efflux permease
VSAQPAAKPPLAILPLLAAAAFASGCGARMLDPLLPLLARDFHVTVAETAIVISAFTLPYGLCQIVLGPLGDRFGKLRVLVLGLLLYGLAMAACATAGALDRLVLLRALTGALGGAIIPLAMAWIGDNVPYSDRQATLGRFLTGMVMAQLLAGPIAGTVGQWLGWQAVFLLVGVLAVLMAFGIMATLGRGLWRPVPSPAGGSGFSRYITLLKRPAGRLLLIAAFLDGMLLFGGAFPFIGSYLIQVFHLEPWQAGLVVAVFGLGSFVYTRMARRAGELASARAACCWWAGWSWPSGWRASPLAALVGRGAVPGAAGPRLLHVSRHTAGPQHGGDAGSPRHRCLRLRHGAVPRPGPGLGRLRDDPGTTGLPRRLPAGRAGHGGAGGLDACGGATAVRQGTRPGKEFPGPLLFFFRVFRAWLWRGWPGLRIGRGAPEL